MSPTTPNTASSYKDALHKGLGNKSSVYYSKFLRNREPEHLPGLEVRVLSTQTHSFTVFPNLCAPR